MNAARVNRRTLLGLAAAFAGAGRGMAQPARSILGSPPLIFGLAGRKAVGGLFANRQGRDSRIADFAGRVVLVNLWSTRCGPCRVEMPSLDRLAAAFPGDLTVLPISFDGGGWEAVDPFWGKQFPHLTPYLAKDTALTEGYGALGLPFSVLIDRQGREVARLPRAAEWDQGPYRALVAKTIASRR